MADMITKTLTVVEYKGKSSSSPKAPYEIVMVDDDGDRGYYKTWEENEATMLSKGGNRKWEVMYLPVENTYQVGKDTRTGISLNIKSIQSAQPAEVAEPEVEEPQVEESEDSPAPKPRVAECVHELGLQSRCAFCIQRQTAFNQIENKDDKSPEEILRLTNIYEDILINHWVRDLSDDGQFSDSQW